MTTKPNIFKPEHFSGINDLLFKNAYDAAADIANRIIDSKLGPKVWGYVGSERSSWISDKPGTYIQENYTHTAYLFDIQKLPEKECIEHKPKIKSGGVSLPGFDDRFGGALMLGCSIVCEVCGDELTAKWEVKK